MVEANRLCCCIGKSWRLYGLFFALCSMVLLRLKRLKLECLKPQSGSAFTRMSKLELLQCHAIHIIQSMKVMISNSMSSEVQSHGHEVQDNLLNEGYDAICLNAMTPFNFVS